MRRPIALNIPLTSDDGRWHCVVVKPNWMSRVQAELYSHGYRSFAPEMRKWVNYARRCRVVRRPVLSRYLFVDVDYPRQSFGAIRAVRGVDVILSAAGRPVTFTRSQVVDFLRRQMTGEWDEASKARPPVGARIRIMEGEHEDALAVVTHVRGRKISYRVDGEVRISTTFDANVRAA